MLKEVARRLRSILRDDDVVARLGGDEFAIVQCQLDRPEAASDLAVRLIQEISDPYVIDGHQVVIGASVGVTIAPTDTAANVPELLARYGGTHAGRINQPDQVELRPLRRA